MAMRQIPAFGALLKRYRQAAGLTQEALASQAGLSTRTISDLERGLKVRPHQNTVALLAAALHLSPREHAAFVAARQGSAPRAAGMELRCALLDAAQGAQGVELGQGVVGQDDVRRWGQPGQKVGLGRHVLPARLEPGAPELVQHQLQVGGGVFEDQDVERLWASVPHAVYGDQGIHGATLRRPGRWHAVVLTSISLLPSRFLPSAANGFLPRHVL